MRVYRCVEAPDSIMSSSGLEVAQAAFRVSIYWLPLGADMFVSFLRPALLGECIVRRNLCIVCFHLPALSI